MFLPFFLGCAMAVQASHVRAEKTPRLAQVEFGDDFLRRDGGAPLDLSRFRQGNPVPVGSYRVDLYVNGVWNGRYDVPFRAAAGETSASPCFERKLLEAIGVDLDSLDGTPRQGDEVVACPRLEDQVPDATQLFDLGELRLDVSLPQVSMRKVARGYVNPASWDQGINAGFVSYLYNGYQSRTPTDSNTSHYLNLNSGLNLGAWRLRNNTTVNRQSDGRTTVQPLATYAQRSIVPWHSQLTVGDSFTSGQLFDSIALRGVRLSTDPRMLPDSQNGYAPVVRGIARTNARVQVSQNGQVIYETTVAPGRFEITDLYPTGFGGNLRVTVTEADGSRHSFDVPYGSVAQLMRPGASRYEFAAGSLRASRPGTRAVGVLQGTYEYGVDNDLTLFGGLTLSPGYLATLGGAAFNTPLGAMSLGLTRSHARISDSQSQQGQSLKLDYNKLITDSHTNIALAAYRYSSSGYLRLQDLQALRALSEGARTLRQLERPRRQLQLTLSQPLGDGRGSFYLVGASTSFWNRAGMTTTYQLGYSNRWRDISYGISAQRQRDLLSRRTDTQYQFQMSMPLGREFNAPTLSTFATRSDSGSTLQTALAGTVGDDHRLRYNAAASRSPGTPGSRNVSAGAEYQGATTLVGASVSQGSLGNRQLSLRASGALVAYAGGIVAAQNLGDTIGIVQADGAAGASLNASGVRLNGSGQAVVPHLTPFRLNDVVLDPKGTSTDVALDTTSQRVAPYAGAVVLMKYGTVAGRSVLIKVSRHGGEAIPFGAEVLDEQGVVIGMAGQGGSIFVRTASDQGRLNVRWGQGPEAQCQIPYALAPREPGPAVAGFAQIDAVCEAPAGMVRRKASPEVLGQVPAQAGDS